MCSFSLLYIQRRNLLETQQYTYLWTEGVDWTWCKSCVPIAFCTYKGETFWKLNNIPTMYRRLKEHMTYTMFNQHPPSTSRYIVEFPGFSFVCREGYRNTWLTKLLETQQYAFLWTEGIEWTWCKSCVPIAFCTYKGETWKLNNILCPQVGILLSFQKVSPLYVQKTKRRHALHRDQLMPSVH
jgi:hypothetical protein